MTNFVEHLTRQIAFSRATFGPGPRTAGVIDHIRKELREIEESKGSPDEWVDVVILALDGLWRALDAKSPHCHGGDIADSAVREIVWKQGHNELRNWPDWRTAPADKAIEHVRDGSASADKTPIPWYPDDSGKWVEYDGDDGLVPAPHRCVEVLFRRERDDKCYLGYVESSNYWRWDVEDNGDDIVAYKVVG